MPRGRSSARGRRGRPRTEWISVVGAITTLVAGANSTLTIVNAGVMDLFTQPTILRVRGTVYRALDDTSRGNDQVVTGGMRVQSDAAGTILPLTDPNSDWMWWNVTYFKRQIANGSELVAELDVDVKAMRRITGRGKSLVYTTQNSGGGFTVNIASAWRALLSEGR